MIPYVTLAEFKTYIDAFIIDTDNYDAADNVKRNKSLSLATRALDRLNYQGFKAVPDQQNQFPRGSDTVVPNAIKNATCELALSYLDDKKLDDEFDNQAIVHEAFMGVKRSLDSNFVNEHLVNGILSEEAWLLVKPFLKPCELQILRG